MKIATDMKSGNHWFYTMCKNNFVRAYGNILVLEGRRNDRSKRTKRFTIKSRRVKRKKKDREGREKTRYRQELFVTIVSRPVRGVHREKN